ncbi:MAG: ABC transporter ATP-binding protein [Candidatus Brocadiae bacterium]|nr:ABC transporter ATP-binding protein [Candidatus Brocadiia bacterium]
MIKIENLHFQIHGMKILKNIQLEFQKGLLHAIIGPNGAGKSTLLKNICRIWNPTMGKVFLDDQDTMGMPRRQLSQKISFVPQETSIPFPVSVEEMVFMGRNPHIPRFHNPTEKDHQIVQKAMEDVEIMPLAKRSIQELSCGERQRVWIACALSTQSPWMLLDEPTSSLDIQHKLRIFSLLQKFKQNGLSVLLSIHELHYAYLYFDTVTILKQGTVYASGPTKKTMTKEALRNVFHVETTFHGTQESFPHFSLA